MRVIGIDPGFERLGIAIVDNNELLFSDCFKTSSKLPFEERILLIGKNVAAVIKKYKPTALAIETLYFTTNQKTAMRVAETRGVVLYEAIAAGLNIKELTPLQVKIALTGYGKAEKRQVAEMVKKLLKIRPEIKSDDELDAIAIAMTGSISR